VVDVLQQGGFDVVAAVDDARDLVRRTRANAPDVVVVDIQMPPNHKDDGLVAAREIRESLPETGVLVLSHYLEDRYAVELFGDRAEGVGYLLKDRLMDVRGFLDAVRRVAQSGSIIDPEVVDRLVDHRRGRDPVARLTPREHEVLVLMAEGRSNPGIAESLVVTVPAIERHVTSIFAKLRLPPDPGGHRRVLAVLSYLGQPARP
jgi:DNA-binding NarL/FixJ family response regulator